MTAVDETIQERIATRAAQWFVLNRNALSDAQSETFVAWLKESPLHVREYLTIAGVSKDMEAILSRMPAIPAEAARDIDDRVIELPGASRATEEPRVARISSGRRRYFMAAAAAIVAAILIPVGMHYSGFPSEHFATERGEQRTLQLEDGSSIRLNTDSAVRIRFTRSARDVKLERGQALFSVAHDPHRPFTVNAGDIDVVALGTRFDVYRRPDVSVVTVVEGIVSVAPTASDSNSESAVRLPAGRQLRTPRATWAPAIAGASSDEATAWTRGEIVFDRKPLGALVEELNRYTPIPIDVRDPALRALPVTGVLDLTDRASFVEFMRRLEAAEVIVTPERIVVTRRKSAASR